MGIGRKAALTPKKHPHLTELHLTGFPLQLKSDIIEIANDQGSSLTELIKKTMRKLVDTEKPKLAMEKRG